MPPRAGEATLEILIGWAYVAVIEGHLPFSPQLLGPLF